jgi:hypothetical protein
MATGALSSVEWRMGPVLIRSATHDAREGRL